jgi:hypothetical protein
VQASKHMLASQNIGSSALHASSSREHISLIGVKMFFNCFTVGAQLMFCLFVFTLLEFFYGGVVMFR